jgi:hypothetical protein
MGFAQYIELLPGSGYGGEGIGAPIFVGRNRTIALTLDVTDAPSSAIASVYLETASSQFATRWRKIGSTIESTGVASTALSATNADAFVRARYAITELGTASAIGLSLAGKAQCILLTSTALTGTGTSDAIDLAQYHGGRFSAVVSSAPGNGQTLALSIERSGDGLSWETAATFASITAAGEYAIESADLDRFVRVKRVPSGNGSWTFGVAGTSHLIFARARDRALLGIRAGAIPNTTATQQLGALIAATGIVVSYYSRYDHPLRAWGGDTSQATIALGDWALLTTQSKDPAKANEGGGTYAEEAARWTRHLELVAGIGQKGRKLNPSGIVDSSPANEKGETPRWSFKSNPNPYGQGNGYGGGL